MAASFGKSWAPSRLHLTGAAREGFQHRRREVRWLNLFLKKETCDISDECIQAPALLAPPLPWQREEKKKEGDAVQLCLHRPRPCPHLHPLAACLSRSLGTSSMLTLKICRQLHRITASKPTGLENTSHLLTLRAPQSQTAGPPEEEDGRASPTREAPQPCPAT